MSRILLFIPVRSCEEQIVRVPGQLKPGVYRELTEVTVVNSRSMGNNEAAAMRYLEEHPLPIPAALFRNDDNYGLGGSRKVAFKYATKHNFDYVIVLYGDDQGDIASVLPHSQSGACRKYDCPLGIRFMRSSKLQGYLAFRTLGNCIYNLLFSVGTGRRIYDLGSGLNMYKVSSLKSCFYEKYKDNLMFNYCTILSSSYHRQNMRFLPVLWREDDQVSNVKMVNQTIVVLKFLGSYIVNRKGFIITEYRDKLIPTYTAKLVYTNRKGKENDDHEVENV